MPDVSRSRAEVRSTIVDVASRLLREQGPAAVTTRGVAEAAGVQAPTIYRLFGDKDGLLEAVAEHVMNTYVTAKADTVTAAAAADVDPVDELHAGWQMQIDFGLANPAVYSLLSDPGRLLHSPAAQSGKHLLEERVRRVAATGRLGVSERRAVDLIQAAGTGAIQTLLSTPTERRDLGLAPAMFAAVLAQILTDPPQHAQDRSVATAIALRAIAPGIDVLSTAERQLLIEWLDRAITCADENASTA